MVAEAPGLTARPTKKIIRREHLFMLYGRAVTFLKVRPAGLPCIMLAAMSHVPISNLNTDKGNGIAIFGVSYSGYPHWSVSLKV
jgi:hypothetical protein